MNKALQDEGSVRTIRKQHSTYSLNRKDLRCTNIPWHCDSRIMDYHLTDSSLGRS